MEGRMEGRVKGGLNMLFSLVDDGLIPLNTASKKAGMSEFFSPEFFGWYALVLVIMFGYAVIWQQVLKRMPLTVAYANRPVSLVWGMIWGALIFSERITWNMILGAGVIFIGILLVVTSDE